MKKDYTKLAENNYWDLTEDEIRQIEEEGYYEAGHWVFYKIDENEYEATRDGVYMHIFKSLKDLMARENEIDAYEYDSDLSDERGEETFINEKGEIREYRNGGRVGRSRDAMFKSQEPHEQKYNRKREWKEYKKEGWMGDWFAEGGGVGDTIADRYARLTKKEAKRLDELQKKVKINEQTELEDAEFDRLVRKYRGWDKKANGGDLSSTPSYDEINWDFSDYEIDEIVDPPYAATGTMYGELNGRKYFVMVDLANTGGDSWEIVDYDENTIEEYRNGGAVGEEIKTFHISGGGLGEVVKVKAENKIDAIKIVQDMVRPIFGTIPASHFKIEKIETYAKGGGVSTPIQIAKMMWNKYDRNGRKEMLMAADYSEGVANDLSLENWESLEKQVHTNLGRILQSGKRKSIGQYANGGDIQDLYQIIIYDRFDNEMHSYIISDYEKAIENLKEDLELSETGSRVDISHNGEVIYSETKKQYSNGGGVGDDTREKTNNYSNEQSLLLDGFKELANTTGIEFNPNDFTLISTYDKAKYYLTKDRPSTNYKVERIFELTGRSKNLHNAIEIRVDSDYLWGSSKYSFSMSTAEVDDVRRIKSSQNFFLFPYYKNKYNEVKGGLSYAKGGGVGLLEDDEKRLKELEDEKEKLKLELLDVSMGIKGGKRQIEAKLGSINDEINNLLKKKYNWKEQYALGGFLSDEELENVSKKINSYINKSGVHIWERKNKRYVPIEVWQYAGQLLEISPRVVSITPIPENNGYLAKAEAINKEGTVISTGFGYVDRKEAKWANSQEYELISFAQTRAVSRVLRNAISYIIRYAGYSTTPAEEMYSVTDEKKTRFGKVEKLKEGEYDFIFDKPGFKQDEKAKEEKREEKKEESAPIKTSAYVEAPKDEMLRTIYRKAVGSNVVIGSPEFMEKIKQELLKDYDPEKRRMIVDEAYSYMTQENVVLDSPAFMRKIKKFLADKPMKDGGTLSNPEDISQTIEEHIIEEIKPIIGDYKDYEIDYESYSKDGQTKQVHLEIKGVSPDIMSSVENDYDTIHNKIKELCDKYDLYFTTILTMEDEEEPSITLVFDYFF